MPARSSSQRWRTPVIAAAAAVAIVAGAVGFLSGRATDGTSSRGVEDLAAAAFADDGNAQAVLTDPAGNEVARVVADGSSGYVLVDALAAPADGQTYQLWRLDGDAPVSLGVLGSVEGWAGGDHSAVAFPLPSAPAGPSAELAITSEPEGGSTAPVGPMVASGVLPLSG
jgi:anti-sigma-K factor RskA